MYVLEEACTSMNAVYIFKKTLIINVINLIKIVSILNIF